MKIFLFILSINFSLHLNGQDSNKVALLKQNDSIYLENLPKINEIPVWGGCKLNNIDIDITNSYLELFIKSVSIDSFIDLEGNKEFYINVLEAIKKDSFEDCFIKYLNIIDTNSNLKYRYSCRETAAILDYKIYCYKMPIKFLVLFFINYKWFQNVSINSSCAIEEIKLIKKNTPENYQITDSDYLDLISVYQNSILNNKIRNPLKNTNFKWKIKTEKFIQLNGNKIE